MSRVLITDKERLLYDCATTFSVKKLDKWSRICKGILCFIEDVDGYCSFKLYCSRQHEFVWEYPYDDFVTYKETEDFIEFVGNDIQVGFLFELTFKMDDFKSILNNNAFRTKGTIPTPHKKLLIADHKCIGIVTRRNLASYISQDDDETDDEPKYKSLGVLRKSATKPKVPKKNIVLTSALHKKIVNAQGQFGGLDQTELERTDVSKKKAYFEKKSVYGQIEAD